MTPPRACARRESYRRHTTRGDERRRRWSRGEAAVREACDAAAANIQQLSWSNKGGRSQIIRATGLSFRARRRTGGKIAAGACERANERGKAEDRARGAGRGGSGVRDGLQVSPCVYGVLQESVCQLSVLAFERSSGGKTERRAAARRTRAPRTADRRRECPRGRPASSGGRVSAHRPQTEKFTCVRSSRARGCWVGDDPPSDASLALCARLMSSRGGVGGVDGDGRDRRSTRPEHWRHQPRCQREKVRYSLRNEPAKSSIGQRHKDAHCLPTRDKCFSIRGPSPSLAKRILLVRQNTGAPHSTRARSKPF